MLHLDSATYPARIYSVVVVHHTVLWSKCVAGRAFVRVLGYLAFLIMPLPFLSDVCLTLWPHPHEISSRAVHDQVQQHSLDQL